MADRRLKLFDWQVKKKQAAIKNEKTDLAIYRDDCAGPSKTTTTAEQQPEMVNLEHLKKYSTVVADTTFYKDIEQFQRRMQQPIRL
ncbi:hypothetical protein M3Y96_00202500 [Aphelenchoides besseyi]|nr:hypothetical protein M3Y96_00202500 [Aphelenchoides besseyi]